MRARPSIAEWLVCAAGAALVAVPYPALADGNAPRLLEAHPPRAALTVARGRFEVLRRESDRARREALALPRRGQLHLSAGKQLEVPSLDGKLILDPAKNQVQSTAVLTVKCTAGPLYSLIMMVDSFSPGTLEVRDKLGTLSASDFYGVKQVSLRTPLATGESVELTVLQSGTPSCSGTSTDCQLSPSMTYNMGTAWMPLLLDESSGYTMVAPPKTTMEVTTPGDLTVAMSALHLGTETNADGTKTHRFQANWKDYLLLTAAPYTVGTSTFPDGTRTAGSYLLAGSQPKAAAWRQAAMDLIGFHEQRYGEYSLPKIDVAEIPDIAGGIGPLSTVFLSHSTLSEDPNDWRGRSTLAHELAHQWFGGFVFLEDNSSPWINEGFATFGEMEYTIAEATKAFSQPYGPTLRRFNSDYYLYLVPLKQDVPLTSELIRQVPELVYFVVTYYKGALVVSMLKYLLGGEAPFLAAINNYREDHVTEGASLSSLVSSFSKASGKDLSCFVTRWIESTGYPTFTVGVQRPRGGEKHGVTVTVSADKEPCLPLELDLLLSDASVVRKQITLSGLKQTVSYETPAEVVQVKFDPEHQILARTVGALGGDIINFNGEVDGLDLIYAAWGQGRSFESDLQAGEAFPDYLDQVFDGKVDEQDLDLVLQSFGKRSGQGG